MTEPVIERNVNHDTINSLKELSIKYIESIESTKRQIKEANEMIKDTLANDVTYLDADTAAKEAAKKRDIEKKRIQSRPEMADLAMNLRVLRAELKEKKVTLSDYLLEFERLSGANVIDKPNGEQLSIFKKAEVTKMPNRS